MASGKRWTVRDRYRNEIYLTEERWQHITEPTGHPEVLPHEAQLLETIQSGQRRQDALDPQKYRYRKAFDELTAGNTHIVAIVRFRVREDDLGALVRDGFIVTAYLTRDA